MRDLARRIQALRKELGFVPTEVLEAAYLAELDSESERLLKPHLAEMAELVRAKEVRVCRQRTEIEVKWYERKLDDKKVYIAIS